MPINREYCFCNPSRHRIIIVWWTLFGSSLEWLFKYFPLNVFLSSTPSWQQKWITTTTISWGLQQYRIPDSMGGEGDRERSQGVQYAMHRRKKRKSTHRSMHPGQCNIIASVFLHMGPLNWTELDNMCVYHHCCQWLLVICCCHARGLTRV